MTILFYRWNRNTTGGIS